jgi:tetratricopeptide (TPR) repeat protein
VAYREVGKTEEAIYSLKKALELRPDVGHPLFSLGLAYMDKGNEVKALSYFSKYKEGYYQSLSLKEKETLDALIKKCKRKP